MTWYDKLLFRRLVQNQTTSEKLVEVARRHFDLNPAEHEVICNTASPLELPSPEENATRPEGPYDENTPRPEVRAAFLCWLATDLEARPLVHAKGLRVYSSTITGPLDLGEHIQLPTLDFRRCTVTDGIVLESSEIRGIHITDCVLSSGIEADGVLVNGPVFLHRTQSAAEIRFINAIIKSNLECQGVRLTSSGDALTLDGATIKGDVFFCQEFESRGEIRMLGTQIDSSLTCTGAKLLGPDDALTLDKARIGGNLLLNGKLQSAGNIRLPNSHIGGDLNFMGAEVRKVLCHNMDLGGDMIWRGVRKPAAGTTTHLNLSGAHIRTLRDDQASWPTAGNLELDHFVYHDLILHQDPTPEQLDRGILTDEMPLDVKQRIQWLKLQSSASQIEPQPWMQLASHLESVNNKAGAKHVLFQLRCLQARESRWLMRRARIAFAWLEEAPARITWSIFLTLFLGTLIFAGASPDRSGAMIPTARNALGQPPTGAALDRYPRFQPFIYTLENALPLVKLGIDDKWTPDPAHQGQPWFPLHPWLNWLGWFNSYGFLTVSRWVIILLGWFQAAVLGAALTNRFKS
jgi:hypothetical protein